MPRSIDSGSFGLACKPYSCKTTLPWLKMSVKWLWCILSKSGASSWKLAFCNSISELFLFDGDSFSLSIPTNSYAPRLPNKLKAEFKKYWYEITIIKFKFQFIWSMKTHLGNHYRLDNRLVILVTIKPFCDYKHINEHIEKLCNMLKL